MCPELFKVDRIDEWPAATPQDKTVWIIRGETIEEQPRRLRLKTTDGWKAALLERLLTTKRFAWVTWMETARGDPWLRRCEADATKFQHDEAV